MSVVFARTGTLETDTEHRQINMNLEGSRYEQRDYGEPDDLTKMHDGIRMGNFPLSDLARRTLREETGTPNARSLTRTTNFAPS